MEPDRQAVAWWLAEDAGIAIPAPHIGAEDHGQGSVSALAMVSVEEIGICFGKLVCSVGREEEQIDQARAHIANLPTHGKTKS